MAFYFSKSVEPPMKRLIIMILFFAVAVPAALYAESYNQQLKSNRDMVKQQLVSDKEKKEAILRKMREFMNDINGRLGPDSKVKIDVPIDLNEVNDIKKTEMIHTSKKVPAKVFAYVLDDIPLRSAGGEKNPAVGKVSFAEQVEVLVQSDTLDAINGKTRPWFLVRRAGGEEGWVFGGYLQKKKPERRETVPVLPEKIEDAAVPPDKKVGTISPPEVTAGKFYAYVSDEDVRMRSGGTSGSEIVGKFSFGERLEVLEQSREMENIGGKNRPWFRVRRTDGAEGWIFGGFLQKKPPESKEASAAVKGGLPGTGDFAVPTEGKVSSRFGYRVHPVTKKSSSFHSGIDLYAPRGTKVNATAGGIVKTASFNQNGYGNLIIIEHEKDVVSYYGHLEKILVTVGRRVNKGDLIGTVDSTGMSTGNHLHFEIRKGGTALDPEAFLR